MAPIVGLDGAVGLPGYSGLLPNPMLAHSLVTVRDLLLSGSASNALIKRTEPETQVKSGSMSTQVKRLQPNVRAALAELELLERIVLPTGVVDNSLALSLRKDDGTTIAGPLLSMHVPELEFFKKQLDLVFSYADLRSERVSEVLAQVVPQTAYWCAAAGLAPERHRYTLELLGAGLRFAMLVVMHMKLLANIPRPVELSAVVFPMILTPGYSAYPSGHATEAYFAAELLSMLHAQARGKGQEYDKNIDKLDKASLRIQLSRLAYRIAENRVVAGLHFPIDSIAGQYLGTVLARYFVGRCVPPDRNWKDSDGGVGAVPTGFTLSAPASERSEPTLDALVKPSGWTKTRQGPVLCALWNIALEEWQG